MKVFLIFGMFLLSTAMAGDSPARKENYAISCDINNKENSSYTLKISVRGDGERYEATSIGLRLPYYALGHGKLIRVVDTTKFYMANFSISKSSDGDTPDGEYLLAFSKPTGVGHVIAIDKKMIIPQLDCVYE